MARRGKELSPQLRSRLCELKSTGWTYKKIKERHPEIPLGTIMSTIRSEKDRVNNVSNLISAGSDPLRGALRALAPRWPRFKLLLNPGPIIKQRPTFANYWINRPRSKIPPQRIRQPIYQSRISVINMILVGSGVGSS